MREIWYEKEKVIGDFAWESQWEYFQKYPMVSLGAIPRVSSQAAGELVSSQVKGGKADRCDGKREPRVASNY